MEEVKIKNHIDRLGRGYRIWTVPIIMLMWDVAFKTGGGVSADSVVMAWLAKPYYLAISAWMLILGFAMDRRGRLLVSALQDTENAADIDCIMLEHNRFADLLIVSPVVYYTAKAIYVYLSGGSILARSFRLDIHGAMTLIAVYDGLKSVWGNILIQKQLN